MADGNRSGVLDGSAQAFGQLVGFDQAGVHGEHRELFAADARQQVAAAHLFFQQQRHTAQHRVAGGVPVLIVDGLEAVDIHRQQAQRPAGFRGAGGFARQLVAEVAAVGQAGQGVGHGQHFELGIGFAQGLGAFAHALFQAGRHVG